MSMQDRPARRTKPVPTADAGVDPVDFRPGPPTSPQALSDPASNVLEGKGVSAPAAASPATAAAPSQPPAPTAIEPELNVTVQSGISWSPQTESLIRAAKSRTGKTRRALVEEAIEKIWGNG